MCVVFLIVVMLFFVANASAMYNPELGTWAKQLFFCKFISGPSLVTVA